MGMATYNTYCQGEGVLSNVVGKINSFAMCLVCTQTHSDSSARDEENCHWSHTQRSPLC